MSYLEDQSSARRSTPHVRGDGELDGPADSKSALELLVQCGYIDDCSVFVCPSSDQVVVVRELSPAERDDLRRFSGFEGAGLESNELSYGWSRAARGPETPPDAPVAADKSIRDPGDARNRGNHWGGRNFIRFGGQVTWVPIADLDAQALISSDVNVIPQDLAALPTSEPASFPSPAVSRLMLVAGLAVACIVLILVWAAARARATPTPFGS